jgi:hypothetical protein
MISRGTRQLRDAILAEARDRGVPLDEESLTIEQGLPVLRFASEIGALLGARVRRPVSSHPLPDVISIHGSGFKTSRTWPRRRDGAFSISAVVDHLLALLRAEIERPKADLPSWRTACLRKLLGSTLCTSARSFSGRWPLERRPTTSLRCER